MKVRKYIHDYWPIYCITAAIFLAVIISGSKTATVIANNTPIERENIIIIDAGHGGEDGGAISCSGVPESKINLEIALKLEHLMHLLGHETLMIRSTDVSIYTEGSTLAAKKVSDLKNRVRIVNNTEKGLLISIHQNTFPDGRYGGAQVFYNKNVDAKNLAVSIQNAFVKTLNPDSKRKSKVADGIYLMEHIERAGVLVECGFLSNVEEEAKLRSDDYQKKLCCVIAASLSQYTSDPTA